MDRRGVKSKINVNLQAYFMDGPYSKKKTSVDPSKNNKEKETRRRKAKAVGKLFAHTQKIILIEKLSLVSFVFMISSQLYSETCQISKMECFTKKVVSHSKLK